MTEPAVCVPSAAGTMPAAIGRGRAGGGAAGRVLEIARVARGGRRVGGELGRHRLADDDGAGPAQRRDAGRILERPTPLEGRAAVLGRHVRRVDDVLDADGEPVQRADALAFLARRVGGLVPAPARARGRERSRPGLAARAHRCARGRRATSSSEDRSPRAIRAAASVAVRAVSSVSVKCASLLGHRHGSARVVERARQKQGEGERDKRVKATAT